MNTAIDQFALADSRLARTQIPLRGADLPLLVSLDVLLEECNVTRAAARLHLSQPALSAQLSRLRLLFDDPLLVPAANGRGLVPSQFALRLHRRLKPALATLSSAIRPDVDEFLPEASARSFAVAATNTAAAMVMPALAGRLRQHRNRGLKVAALEPDFGKLAGQLERGEIDLCVSPACFLPPGLCVTDLLTMPHVMVQRRGHPRGEAPVALHEYCEVLDHVTVSRDGSLHGYIDEQLYRQGHTRHVAMAVRDVCYVAALCQSSDLVCTLPAQLVPSLQADLIVSPVLFPLSTYSLCMAWHPRSDGEPGLQWLRGELEAIAAAATF